MFTSYRNALAAVLIALTALYLLGTIFAALAHDPTPTMTHAEHTAISRLVKRQAKKIGVPNGCAVIGGWEDGSIVAYCTVRSGKDRYISHGPDRRDSWQSYTGIILDAWVRKVNRLDGRV